MAATPSTMIPLGTPVPDFALRQTDGAVVRREDFAGQPLLVIFMCNHCPFVKHVRHELATLTRDYHAKGVGVIGINSNDVANYPDDSPAMMALEVHEAGYTFPYLFDESQAVARAFDAACTPDFFLYDRKGTLYYRGQLDDSRPGTDIPVTGRDLRAALDALLANRPAPPDQLPSMGCNIKWKQSD